MGVSSSASLWKFSQAVGLNCSHLELENLLPRSLMWWLAISVPCDPWSECSVFYHMSFYIGLLMTSLPSAHNAKGTKPNEGHSLLQPNLGIGRPSILPYAEYNMIEKGVNTRRLGSVRSLLEAKYKNFCFKMSITD